MAGGKKTYNKKPTMAKGRSRTKTYKKKSGGNTTGIITTLSEATHRVSLKGQLTHFSAADSHQCVSTVKCMPNITKQKLNGAGNAYEAVALFPDWATQSAMYEFYRVVYFSVSVIFDSNKSLVNSTVERDGTDITDIDNMMKSVNFKAVSLDGDNKKVFRAWKAASSAEYDWRATDTIEGANPHLANAHIKLLQDGLPKAVAGLDPLHEVERRQKCEIQATCVVEFKGRKN